MGYAQAGGAAEFHYSRPVLFDWFGKRMSLPHIGFLIDPVADVKSAKKIILTGLTHECGPIIVQEKGTDGMAYYADAVHPFKKKTMITSK